jgi:hypothetical protein
MKTTTKSLHETHALLCSALLQLIIILTLILERLTMAAKGTLVYVALLFFCAFCLTVGPVNCSIGTKGMVGHSSGHLGIQFSNLYFIKQEHQRET